MIMLIDFIAKFYVVLKTPAPMLGYGLKTDTNMFVINSCKHENELELFLDYC